MPVASLSRTRGQGRQSRHQSTRRDHGPGKQRPCCPDDWPQLGQQYPQQARDRQSEVRVCGRGARWRTGGRVRSDGDGGASLADRCRAARASRRRRGMPDGREASSACAGPTRARPGARRARLPPTRSTQTVAVPSRKRKTPDTWAASTNTCQVRDSIGGRLSRDCSTSLVGKRLTSYSNSADSNLSTWLFSAMVRTTCPGTPAATFASISKGIVPARVAGRRLVDRHVARQLCLKYRMAKPISTTSRADRRGGV